MASIRTVSISLLAVVAAVGLVGCSSDDSSSTTTTTAAEESTTSTTSAAESAATVRFDKQIQQELADVGCYSGSVDGIMGSETDAAIVEFQKAAGLSADGELGPETEAALKAAVAKGEKVCGATTSTTTTAKATTTTAKPSGSPCTATALLEGIGGDPSTTITSYVCADGYAAGTLGDGSTRFILVATDGSWERPSQDPCGSASAGLPPVILQDGCPD